ncbi:hypothetical protein LZ31DRAFT_591680 [Colletotrichum somersetense]|nr:hypothetical protein LZ31DRAFT_591680 [Colletotrichum somersetense]
MATPHVAVLALAVLEDINNPADLTLRILGLATEGVMTSLTLLETLASADKSGSTPLHYALDFRQCHNKPPEYVEAVKKMILAGDDAMKKKKTLFNRNQESPLIYSLNRAVEASIARQKKTASQSKNTAQAASQTLKEETGDRQIQTPTQAKAPPTASRVTRSKEINGEKGSKSTSSTNHEKDVLRWRALMKIRDFITTHYIRTRPDMEARDLIFSKRILGKGLDMNLCFDARGRQEARKIVDLLGQMSVGGFHSTLAYVYLPAIVHSPTGTPFAKPTAADRTRQAENKNTIGPEGLIQVFEKL